MVVSRRVKYLPTIIAPRDYVIQTTLDFSARFPGHRGADTSPTTTPRQPLFWSFFLNTRVLSNSNVEVQITIPGIVL